MKRVLYHGSKDRIVKPLFGAGRLNNDYGRGFYCTESEDLAKEWAVANDHDGWANVYSLNDDGLNVLNLNSNKYCLLNWLAVLLENRQFETEYGLPLEAKAYLTTRFAVPYKEADAIIGYRQLASAMRLGHLGDQYVLKSRKAFGRIRHVESRPALRSEWLERKNARDHAARQEYLSALRHQRVPGDLRIDRIIDEEIGPDDERLR